MQQSLGTILWTVTHSPSLPLKSWEDQNWQQNVGRVVALVFPLHYAGFLQASHTCAAVHMFCSRVRKLNAL